ncbi:MAG TPA: class A beta-lactamase [Microvirga sp.]|nr:class A beta-lactamase [Microvirga sp.]
MPRLLLLAGLCLGLFAAAPAGAGGLAEPEALQARLERLAQAHPGRVGICAQAPGGAPVCVNGEARFALQSVMKLVVGAAVMAAVDAGRLKLEDRITVQREDMSVFVQPIEKIVAKEGAFATTVGDLVRRAVAESDSAATDVLIARLGGPAAVQAWLAGKGLSGIRIDRDERHLQTEGVGLAWRAEYTDPARLDAAIKAVPKAERDAAFAASLKDERDTATPRGMTAFLAALAEGRLLSPASTGHFLAVMRGTVTFPDRLRAGAPDGWSVAHKTGTSRSWNGITAVTNDVGVLTAPDGGTVAVAAFVAESTAPAPERAAVIANAARAVAEAYR